MSVAKMAIGWMIVDVSEISQNFFGVRDPHLIIMIDGYEITNILFTIDMKFCYYLIFFLVCKKFFY